MRKTNRLLFFIFVIYFLFSVFVRAEEGNKVFKVLVDQKRVILSVGGETFIISSDDDTQCIKIKDSAGIIPYYRYMREERYIYLTGNSLKNIQLITDNKDNKEVKISLQEEPEFQLELNLCIYSDLPCLFIKSFLRNTSGTPKNGIGFEWFVNHSYTEYISQVSQRCKMPKDEHIGIDYTCGMPTKVDWATIGTSRIDRWVYLISTQNPMKSLGIISGEPTSFGVRSNHKIYWGEKRGTLEEGEEFLYNFILVPLDKFEFFKKILPQILGRLNE